MKFLALSLAMLSALMVFAPANSAQNVLEVPAATATEHLTRRVEPVYPAMAKTMKLQGRVTLKVVVTETGEVESAKFLTGPPILVQAAIGAVKQWRYAPFVAGGNPTKAAFEVVVPFSLGVSADQQKSEQEINQAFFNQEDVCRKQLKAQDLPAAEASCVPLVDLAEKLPKGQQLERMEANHLAGVSVFGQRKFPQALEFFQREVKIAEATLHPTDADLGGAYEHLAWGYQATGDQQKAAAFYLQAEATLRKAREHVGDDDPLKNEYAKQIRGVLIYYIAFLHQTGQEALASQAQERADAIAKEIHE
jgi:TonB family protein